jgi:hypothetical protein
MRVFRQKDGKHGGCASFSPRWGKCREATMGDIEFHRISGRPQGVSFVRKTEAVRPCILFPPGKCHSMTFGAQKHPIFVSQTYLFSYLVTKTPLFCFPNDFLIIQGDVTPAKMKNIFGACKASSTASAVGRKACLSSERRKP